MRKFTFLKQYWFSLVIAWIPGISVAAGPSIGDMAENIAVPTEMLTKLALIACYIIGAALIFTALAQYKIHRQSPKLVPLTTPIVLLILGIISIFIPYSSKMFGDTFSAVERSKEESQTKGKNTLLPLPDVDNKGPLLPAPSRQAPAEQPTSVDTAPPQDTSATPYNSGGGHWTDDPRYNQ